MLGKGQTWIVEVLEEMRQALPFPLHGIDSDNGSDFLNHHLVGYCRTHRIQLTRGRPYKKDDNAHIGKRLVLAIESAEVRALDVATVKS